MPRKENKTLQGFKKLYSAHSLNLDDVFHKSKLLLKSYRSVVWSTIQNADEIQDFAEGYYSDSIDIAMIYLTEFADPQIKAGFEEKLTCLCETKYMINLIDKAMNKIYDYPHKGRLYHELLSKSYMTAFTYTESELLEILDLERSTFFERKKEAIHLFGIALWGYALPELKVILTNCG